METRVVPELKLKIKVCGACGNRVMEFGDVPEIKYVCSDCID